jgi:hypothetical protein
VGTPLGLLLSLIGLLFDRHKTPALVGLGISGSLLIALFVIPWLLSCR